MVDRPDWINGAPAQANGSGGAIVTTGFDGRAYIADLERRHNGGGGLPPSAYSADGQAITIRHDWNAPDASGLSPELAREMSSTVDGFAANVSLLKESATRLLDEFGQSAAVEEHFESLSPSIQTKVFRELWLHPGISFLDLLDVVEPTLTLAEAHEAEQWLRKLRGL